jgi:uncharacterized zinc-type alcohol dehydrogenase-like protein
MSAVINYTVGKYNEFKNSFHSLKHNEEERLVTGYAAYAPTLGLKPYAYVAPKLENDQVEVKIEYCGLCYSDITMINNAIMSSQYPFIPGHEIVGRVTAVGSEVDENKFPIGQRVGIGWMRESCHHCSK